VSTAALLVIAGAAVLWPALARSGRGVATAAMVALLFATPAYGVARDGGWIPATAFLAASALVAAGLGPEAAARTRWIWRAGAAAAALLALVALWAAGSGADGIVDGLFSSGNGLLFWSPAAWLGLAGLAGLGRRLPSRALAPALLIAAAAAADAGPVRGGRFAPVLPLLGLGMAWTLAALRDACARRPLLPIAAAAGALAAWNFLLMAQYGGGGVPRDDTVAFERVVRNAAASVSAAAGAPTAWPANWAYAARNGVPPARYDLLAGVDLFDGPLSLGGVIEVGDARTDAALLDGAWSVRHPCGAGICRAVEGAATVRVPLRRPREVVLSVVASGAGTLTVSVNGVAVLAAPLDDVARERLVRVPAGRLRAGLNALTLSVDAGGRALVDRLAFDGGGPA
jgi:hypothetical protein